MTYRQPATCRRGGCGEPASAGPASCEGDIGWCDPHLVEVQRTRHRLTVGIKSRGAAYRSTEAKARV